MESAPNSPRKHVCTDAAECAAGTPISCSFLHRAPALPPTRFPAAWPQAFLVSPGLTPTKCGRCPLWGCQPPCQVLRMDTAQTTGPRGATLCWALHGAAGKGPVSCSAVTVSIATALSLCRALPMYTLGTSPQFKYTLLPIHLAIRAMMDAVNSSHQSCPQPREEGPLIILLKRRRGLA